MMSSEINKGPTIGIRHLQSFLIFLDIVVVYVSRLNIAVAVVAMTNVIKPNPNYPTYEWNEKVKAYILSSFFWGYVTTQFLGGYLSRRYGSKSIMFLSTFGSTIFVLLTPISISWGGWQALCAMRVIQGVFQGLMFPAIHQHLAKWSPPNEKNRLGAFSQTGIEFGTLMAMAISGVIADGPMGWPGISYVSGGMCLAWCVIWLIFSANNAPSSRFISKDECNYIEGSLMRNDDFHKQSIPIPWKAIFSSQPFCAWLIARCAQAWGLNTLQAQLPSYMNGVLKLDMRSNGFYNALPYLAMFVMAFVFLIMSELIQKRQWLSLTAMRKLFNSIAYWVPALGLVAIGFLDEDNRILALCLLTASLGMHSGCTIGSILNSLDLSPNHAGILMGIVNMALNFMPLISPLVVSVIVTNEEDRTQWQIIFAIAAVVLFLGNLVYVIWGTTETQPWNDADFLTKTIANKKYDGEIQMQKSNNNNLDQI